MDMSPALTERT